MSKKMMLLALAVVALFALPSAASAQEIHMSGITSFTGSAGISTLSATGEPTITCGATAVTTGSFDSGSSTTGKLTLDFTGCKAEFLGATPSCNTKEAAAGTIASGGTFHLITVNNRPGMLMTFNASTIICAGFSNLKLTGNLIFTIQSPACGASSAGITLTSGSVVEHGVYTGKSFDLTVQTGSSTLQTAGLATGVVVLTSATEGKLECT